MANILTLQEAMKAVLTDNDIDDEIKNELPAIDAQIYIGTGFKVDVVKNPVAIELAKGLARVKLRLALGKSTNPEQDIAREINIKLQLQGMMATWGASILEAANGTE